VGSRPYFPILAPGSPFPTTSPCGTLFLSATLKGSKMLAQGKRSAALGYAPPPPFHSLSPPGERGRGEGGKRQEPGGP
jgi:hypothetical protein